MIGRRRQQVEEPQPLSPDDDPYQAYLLWRAERDAEIAASMGESPDEAVDAQDEGPSGIRGLFGRLSARRHVNREGGTGLGKLRR